MKKILENIIAMDEKEYRRFTFFVQLFAICVILYVFFSVRAMYTLKEICIAGWHECPPCEMRGLDFMNQINQMQIGESVELPIN